MLERTTSVGAHFYEYDGGGNVCQITSSTGATEAKYSYDTFGITNFDNTTVAQENPYRYSTKEWHGQAGLYDYGFRFLSPSLGRWINRDPIGENGGINVYAFVQNDGANWSDGVGASLLSQTLYGMGGFGISLIAGGIIATNPEAIPAALALGFLSGFIGNILGQLTHVKLRCVDWWSAILSGAASAATVAAAILPGGEAGRIAWGAAIGGISNGIAYAIDAWINHSFDWNSLGAAVAAGIGGGFFSGVGGSINASNFGTEGLLTGALGLANGYITSIPTSEVTSCPAKDTSPIDSTFSHWEGEIF